MREILNIFKRLEYFTGIEKHCSIVTKKKSIINL